MARVTCRDAIIKALEGGPLNYNDLAELTGRHHGTVVRSMQKLRADKIVRIAMFEQDKSGREQQMVFALGSRTDAKPARMSRAERSQRWRNKKSNRSGLLGFLYGTKETRHAQ